MHATTRPSASTSMISSLSISKARPPGAPVQRLRRERGGDVLDLEHLVAGDAAACQPQHGHERALEGAPFGEGAGARAA